MGNFKDTVNHTISNLCTISSSNGSYINNFNNPFSNIGTTTVYTILVDSNISKNVRYVIGGNFTNYKNGTQNNTQNLCRISVNGTIDSNFLGSTTSTVGFSSINNPGSVRNISYDSSNGYYVISGQFSQYTQIVNGPISFCSNICRISSGNQAILDRNFVYSSTNPTTGLVGTNNITYSCLVDNSTYIFAGVFNLFGQSPTSTENASGLFRIKNLNTTPTYDTTFITSLIGFGTIQSIFIDADFLPGTTYYVLGGNFYIHIGPNNILTKVSGICRVTDNGVLDTSFNAGGGLFNDNPNATQLVNVIIFDTLQNFYVVGGQFAYYFDGNSQWYYVNNICRFYRNGDLDTDFICSREATVGYGFGKGSSFTTAVVNSIFHTQGSYIVGGDFNYFVNPDDNAFFCLCLASINSSGFLETSFISNGNGFHGGFVQAVLYDSIMDAYVVGGNFTYFTNNSITGYMGGICRILAIDGSLDQRFIYSPTNVNANGFSVSNTVFSIDIDRINNYYVLGGNLSRFLGKDGTSYYTGNLCRLDYSGNFDTTFLFSSSPSVSVGFNKFVACVYVDNQNDYVVGGNFVSFTQQNTSTIEYASKLARVFSSGSKKGTLDQTFVYSSTLTNVAGYNANVNSIAYDPDPGFVIGGSYSSFTNNDGSKINNLVLISFLADPVVCFLENCLVTMANGTEKPIQEITVGDKVLGGLTKRSLTVKHIGFKNVKMSQVIDSNKPCKIPKGFFSPNLPSNEVYLSGHHRLFYKMNEDHIFHSIQAYKLFGLVPVQVLNNDVFKYFHMELETFEPVLVSGLLAETLQTGEFEKINYLN